MSRNDRAFSFSDVALYFDLRGPMDGDAHESALKTAALHAALDEGLAELDAGLGVDTTPEDLLAEVFDELALASNAPRVRGGRLDADFANDDLGERRVAEELVLDRKLAIVGRGEPARSRGGRDTRSS